MYYIGVDLGTSSVKLALTDERANIIRTVSKEYPLYMPRNGWSEQNPDDWWQNVCDGIRELVGEDADQVAALSFSGQMHGLVILDEQDQIIRPAILWNDGRTDAQTKYLNEVIGEATLAENTANIAFAGFTAPKLLWVAENEPENFSRIRKIMLPKDYIAYRLTGVHCTDYSDASGMLLLDVQRKCWSEKMMEICNVTAEQLPSLYESDQVVGTLQASACEATGLPTSVRVCAGAGDNAAAAIGSGIVEGGMCNLSVGTSGTVFIATDQFVSPENHTIHSFAHATGNYHLMGCILSAAVCNQWWMQDILQTVDHAGEQALIQKLGQNTVFFAPYFMGERSPHNDTAVRGAFLGISLETHREDMLQAILEGVAFALRDCLEIAKKCGTVVKKARLCGGGAKSPLWAKIIANVIGLSVEILEAEDSAARGAALLAISGTQAECSVSELAERAVQIKNIVEPTEELTTLYNQQYEKFRKIYSLLKQFS